MDRYNSLYPPFHELLLNFEELFKREVGIPIFLFCGFRSHEKQQRLYNIGRRNIEGEKIITKAKPGSSFHQYGIAADYVFDANLIKPGVQWSWSEDFPWHEIGRISKQLGFEWGGDFVTLKDRPHIQKRWGISIEKAKWYYEGSGLKAVWNYLDLSRTANGSAKKDYQNVESVKAKIGSQDINKPVNDLEIVQDSQKSQEVKKTNKIVEIVIKIIGQIISFIKRFYETKRKVG